ncbi:DeoR family transcriptional regulator [Candidatus Parcubacteria bacterium]|nr:DeoR family transcriptional regulator [Candidatus Parcubacteria bacterium]
MTDDRVKQAVRISVALYRVTDRFPETDPLRHRLRDAAINVVVAVSQEEFDSVAQAVKTIEALGDVAASLTYVSSMNFLVLKSSYGALLRSWQPQPPRSAWPDALQHQGVARRTEAPSLKDMNDPRRQDRIVKMLRDRGEVQLRDLITALGDVSSRTIRRELNRLRQLGMVERRGFGASSFYRILA